MICVAYRERHYWLTPPDIYARLDAEFHFDFGESYSCPPMTTESHALNDGQELAGVSGYLNPPPDTRPNVHFSSLTNEWPTPQWLFDALHAEFAFTLDPCSTHENAKCPKHYTEAENGLEKSWQGEVVFMNPPYGKHIAAWMKKAHEAANEHGATVVCLVPSRTDTKWWHAYAMSHEIRLLRGRLTFQGGKYGAPFPSAIIVMRPRSFRIIAADSDNPAICSAEEANDER